MGTHHQRVAGLDAEPSRHVLIDARPLGREATPGVVLVRGFSRDLIAFKNPKRHPRTDKRAVQKWIAHERLTPVAS